MNESKRMMPPKIPKSIYMPDSYEDLVEYNNYLKTQNLPKVRIEYISFEHDEIELNYRTDRQQGSDETSTESLFKILLSYLSHPKFYFSNPHKLKPDYSNIVSEFFIVINSVLNPEETRDKLANYYNNSMLMGVDKVSITVGSMTVELNKRGKWELVSLKEIKRVLYLPEFIESISEKLFYKSNIQILVSYSKGLFIGRKAFDNSLIKYLITSGSVIGLSPYSFSNCAYLEYIWLNDDLQSIPKYAFYECTNLHMKELPKKLQKIGEEAFSNSNIEIEKIPSYVEEIGEEAFKGCKNIKRLDFTEAENLAEIENYAFSECYGLESVIFRNNRKLVMIDYCAFLCCKALKKVAFEGDMVLTRFSKELFMWDKKLQTVLAPKSLKRIEKEAFYDCEELQEIDLSHTKVHTIGENAFNNTKLKKIIVADKEELYCYDTTLQKYVEEK